MADEVVDIRKRIEEMRNEVSAAIIANREARSTAQSLGHNSDISLILIGRKIKFKRSCSRSP